MDMFQRIERERSRLNEDREDHLHSIEKIDVELADWDAAERIFRKLRAEDDTEISLEGAEPLRERTAKDLTLQILEDVYPNGLKLAEVQEYAKGGYSRVLNINSLSVCLQRLKTDGDARMEKRRWYFIKDAPPEQTDGAP